MPRRVPIVLFACAALLLVGLWGARLILKSRERARATSCLSNTKVIMLVMHAYALDYDDHWPNALTCPELLLTHGSERWPRHGLVPSTLECFQEKHRPIDRISYAMLQCRSYQSLSADPHPESLIVLYEIGKYGPAYRHNDGMNIGHADGHVKWYYRNRMTPGVILSGSVPPPPAP